MMKKLTREVERLSSTSVAVAVTCAIQVVKWEGCVCFIPSKPDFKENYYETTATKPTTTILLGTTESSVIIDRYNDNDGDSNELEILDEYGDLPYEDDKRGSRKHKNSNKSATNTQTSVVFAAIVVFANVIL